VEKSVNVRKEFCCVLSFVDSMLHAEGKNKENDKTPTKKKEKNERTLLRGKNPKK